MTAHRKDHLEHFLVAVTVMVAGTFFASPILLAATAIIAH
jgi:hypothetical protein